MNNSLLSEVEGLTHQYPELKISEHNDQCLLTGPLNFSASFENLETITASFDVIVSVPSNYPVSLPSVLPNGFDLDERFDHINPNGSFCLAVPIEERRLFDSEPTLLGFINNLLVPFFYSYCYFMKYGAFPFGESEHGDEGILDHYRELFDSRDIRYTIFSLHGFCTSGYKPHETCPCGSKKKVLKCHKLELKTLLKNRALLVADLNKFIQD